MQEKKVQEEKVEKKDEEEVQKWMIKHWPPEKCVCFSIYALMSA